MELIKNMDIKQYFIIFFYIIKKNLKRVNVVHIIVYNKVTFIFDDVYFIKSYIIYYIHNYILYFIITNYIFYNKI